MSSGFATALIRCNGPRSCRGGHLGFGDGRGPLVRVELSGVVIVNRAWEEFHVRRTESSVQ